MSGFLLKIIAIGVPIIAVIIICLIERVKKREGRTQSSQLYKTIKCIEECLTLKVTLDDLYYVRQNTSNITKFETRGVDIRGIVPRLPSLELKEIDEYGYYIWEAHSSEFKKCFQEDGDPVLKFLPVAAEIVKNKADLPRYSYVINRYETTLTTVLDALVDSLKINEVVTTEVRDKIDIILCCFYEELIDALEKEEKEEEKEKEAANKEVTSMLDFELEYLSQARAHKGLTLEENIKDEEERLTLEEYVKVLKTEERIKFKV